MVEEYLLDKINLVYEQAEHNLKYCEGLLPSFPDLNLELFFHAKLVVESVRNLEDLIEDSQRSGALKQTGFRIDESVLKKVTQNPYYFTMLGIYEANKEIYLVENID